MTEDIDEFVVRILEKYNEKSFKSVASDDLALGGEEEKKKLEQLNTDNKTLLEALKKALGDKVNSVVLSGKLKNNPVCLSASGDLSLEMERILNAMPDGGGVKAQRVLEINPDHAIFTTLKKLLESDKDKLALYAGLLYTQALIIEGMPIDDPVDFTNKVCAIMA
jgi:molecular chaperone HtpG